MQFLNTVEYTILTNHVDGKYTCRFYATPDMNYVGVANLPGAGNPTQKHRNTPYTPLAVTGVARRQRAGRLSISNQFNPTR